MQKIAVWPGRFVAELPIQRPPPMGRLKQSHSLVLRYILLCLMLHCLCPLPLYEWNMRHSWASTRLYASRLPCYIHCWPARSQPGRKLGKIRPGHALPGQAWHARLDWAIRGQTRARELTVFVLCDSQPSLLFVRRGRLAFGRADTFLP